jgi:hypothetical protein
MHNDVSPEGYSSPLLPFAPQAQTKANDVEHDETLAQVPLLKTVIKRLEKRIAETDSNRATRLLAQKYELSVDNASALQEIINQILTIEKGYIEARIKRAKP